MESKLTFADMLTLMFVYLKLTHNIEWNWAFVISPIIITIIGDAILKKLFSWAKKRKDLQVKT